MYDFVGFGVLCVLILVIQGTFLCMLDMHKHVGSCAVLGQISLGPIIKKK